MKKMLLLSLSLLTLTGIAPKAHAMENTGKNNNSIRKTANVLMNTGSEVMNSCFSFMYFHPFLTAFALTPVIPNKMAPIRRLAARYEDNPVILLAGIAIRANLLHIFSHEYLKERGVAHKRYSDGFLASQCSCDKV